MVIAISLGIVFIVPGNARAGVFGNLWKILSGDTIASDKGTSAAAIAIPLLGSQSPLPAGVGGPMISSDKDAPLVITQDSALVAARNPAGTLPAAGGGDQILVYTVATGDTPGSIAEKFGITLNTLLWANNLRKTNPINIGDTLIILPVSGVRYEIKKGDTVESIANKFKPKDSDEDTSDFVNDILSYNSLGVDEDLTVGMEIIIPDGELSITPPAYQKPGRGQPARIPKLPEFIGYYLRPIVGGRKTQGIHGYNAVDLANSCNSAVFASASGQVIIDRFSGWNGGYGKYVAIAHPNNTQTLYAHLSEIFVNVGEQIGQGDIIGLVGSTGRSTGCHVHFEIRGARNPF